MSRRPPPAADRTEQNRQTLKSLVKLESNKSCADCKRNKHPRWASWNLGIFVCIRCSGIHRGMGTHISRVKSVDLDSWTDEQLQSMLKWGNARANKYWEAKLAHGHVPSEAKIENFIRTKYESKRWVMDGGMPDPATLDVDSEDDVPLNVVKEKVQLERSSSQRTPVSASTNRPNPTPSRQPQNIDLFGDDATPAPPRPSTTGPLVTRPPQPRADPAPPKQTKPADSLLGLDLFGGTQSAPPIRPSSTGQSASSVPSRPDLKQSILSLYASAPKPPPQPQAQHGHSGSLSGLQSPGLQHRAPQQSSLGGLNDAFSSLDISPPTSQQQSKPSAFSGLDSYTNSRSTSQTTSSSAFGGGGSFFDVAPKPAPASKTVPTQQQQQTLSSSSGFGDFSSFTSSTPGPTAKRTQIASSGLGDLFELSTEPTSTVSAPKPFMTPPLASVNSAFNLSSPAPPSQPQPSPVPTATSNFSGFSNMDAWGSTNAWATPSNNINTSTATQSNNNVKSSGWSNPAAPQISQDEDFGDWGSAAPVSNTQAPSHTSSQSAKPLAGSDDLFSNVWE